MPWNGAGVYSPPVGSFPEVNGTIIDAVRFDATINDLASGITAALAKNGENIPTANLPMGSFKHTGVGDGAAAGQYVAFAQATNAYVAGKWGVGAAVSTASGLEVVGASNTVIVRQTAAAAYCGLRIYNDQNNQLRALEIDYSGSTYASSLISGSPVGEQATMTTTGNFPLSLGTNNTARLVITGAGVVKYDDRVSGQYEIGFRAMPVSLVATGTIGVNDVGKLVEATGGITIPNAIFSGGDAVTIMNTTGASITITQGASHTLREAGTANTGNRTLAAFGIATVVFLNSTASFISGAGLS